jgi:hypothetical protein
MIDDLFLGITKNFIEKQTSNTAKKDKKDRNVKNNKTINIDKLPEPTKSKKKGCC